MGLIKSALELALERTEDIQADKNGLEERRLKEEGMKLFALLESGNEEKADEQLAAVTGDERKALLKGLLEVLINRITLPVGEHSLDLIPVYEKAISVLFAKNKGLQAIPEQIRQFYSQYLDDRKKLVEALTERYEPVLREKEQQLAQQTGQRVQLRPEMEPEFNKALNANLEHLNGQYNHVIEQVRAELRQRFDEEN